MGGEGAIKDLHGSEGNPTPLVEGDFETSVVRPVYRMYIYKTGWQEVTEKVDITCDHHFAVNIVSTSLSAEIDDKDAVYHPLGPGEKADYFTYGRKIRVYMGLEKKVNESFVPYTWPYFEGYIRNVQHHRAAEGRRISIRALDYCDSLNAHTFDDSVFWGASVNINLQEDKFEYSLPAGCKGVHSVTRDGDTLHGWTYNWETNVLAFTRVEPGTATVRYYTTQNVLGVVESILDMTLIGSGDLVSDPTAKTIERVYFDAGTTALHAIELLCQLVNYRFYFDGEGRPHFVEEYDADDDPVFSFKEHANVEFGETEIEDMEYYNAVEVHGESRIRRGYLKEEVQIGSTIGASLDVDTVNRDHNFTFANKDRLRYELDAVNKSGLTSEMVETKTGAKVSVMHDPARSFDEEVTSLGNVTGSLGYSVVGKEIRNTQAVRTRSHVPATRVRYSVPDGYNRFGLNVELNPLDYRTTEINLDHDPMRHLSTSRTYLGNVTGSLGHTVVGKELRGTEVTRTRTHAIASRVHYEIPAGYNRSGMTVALNMEDYWTTHIDLTHDPIRHLSTSRTYLGQVSGSLHYSLSGGQIINTDTTRTLSHILATRIESELPSGYNRNGLTVAFSPRDYWTTEVRIAHDPLRNLSTTVQTIGSTSTTATTTGRLFTIPFTTGRIFGNVRWEASFATGWGPEQQTGSGSWNLSYGQKTNVTIPLSPGNQGQHRWTGTKPANLPKRSGTINSGSMTIPALWIGLAGLGTTQSKHGATGFTTYARSQNYNVSVDPGVDETTTHYLPNAQIANGNNFSVGISWYVIATSASAEYHIVPLGAEPHQARFRLEVESPSSFWYPVTTPPGNQFSVQVYSRRMPYGTRVVQEELTPTYARFKATCDFGTPSVSVVCRGQEPTSRAYRVNLYGYQPVSRPYRIDLYGYQPTSRPYRIDLRGNRLVSRHYYLKLFGRDVVEELEDTVYAHKSLTQAEIEEVGGKKTLSIHNHLIQSKNEAVQLAQELLNFYSQHVSSYTIQTTCPPPLEVGDSVGIIAEP